MSFDQKTYIREYMRAKRALGIYPTNWRLHKKNKNYFFRLYKFLQKIFKFNVIFKNQKYGHSTFKTCYIGVAVGPIFVRMGYAPSLNKRVPNSKRVLLIK